jgi:AcrR family transcriptional regulator
MADVAAEAKASIGSLYFRFGDKSQFVEAVLAVALEEVHERGFALCEAAEREKWPERRILEGWVSVVVTSVRERQALVRELISHMATRPEAWKPIHDRRRQVEDRLLLVLAARSGRSHSPARTMRLRMGLQVVAATVIHMVVVDPGPLRIADPAVENVLGGMLLSFIEAPAGKARTRPGPRGKVVRPGKT